MFLEYRLSEFKFVKEAAELYEKVLRQICAAFPYSMLLGNM